MSSSWTGSSKEGYHNVLTPEAESVKGLLPSPQKGEHDIAVSLGYSPSLNFLFVLII